MAAVSSTCACCARAWWPAPSTISASPSLMVAAPEVPARLFGLPLPPLPRGAFYLWILATLLAMLAVLYLAAARDPRRYSAIIAVAIGGRLGGRAAFAAAALRGPDLARPPPPGGGATSPSARSTPAVLARPSAREAPGYRGADRARWAILDRPGVPRHDRARPTRSACGSARWSRSASARSASPASPPSSPAWCWPCRPPSRCPPLGVKYYIGSVVSKSLVRELGPVLTALIVGGRIGAGMTAEIGTMKVTEQIDALRSMAADPVKKLVVAQAGGDPGDAAGADRDRRRPRHPRRPDRRHLHARPRAGALPQRRASTR